MQSCGGYPWFPSVSDAGVMTSFAHDTAPAQYAESGGTGNLDDHDPALSDAFASDREVISFGNAGVASSSGIVPDTIEAMARASTQRCSPATRAPSSTTSRSG